MKAILEWWWKKRMARMIKLRLSLYRNDWTREPLVDTRVGPARQQR
jgi:hypothetical protein